MVLRAKIKLFTALAMQEYKIWQIKAHNLAKKDTKIKYCQGL